MTRQLVADDGFFFGLGAFETIAVEDGSPALLDWHIERMLDTLWLLGICSNAGDLEKLAREGLSQPGAHEGRKVLKLVATPENRMAVVRENHYTEEDRRRGFSLVTSTVRRNPTSLLVRHKTLEYGENILEKRRAKMDGFDEPLFLNDSGNVAEGATTNVFLVLDGQMTTPPVSDGLLPGVMRRFVMERFEVVERSVSVQEARFANEVFVTNSLLGAMPVSSWDGMMLEGGHAAAEEVQAAYENEFPQA